MPKRIAAIITVVDSWPVAQESLKYLMENSTPELTEVILLNNGSFEGPQEDFTAKYPKDFAYVEFPENVGANGVFHKMLPILETMSQKWPEKYNFEVVAYFHNDMMIREEGWDQRIIAAFDKDPKLALTGFLGSNEIDGAGGRGLGTSSSYMGFEYETGWASKAEIHGRRIVGIEAAAVLDHCSMIFRICMLKQLPAQEASGLAPHHFYDRILSCEVLERDWHIAMVGIQCDHFGGGTGLCKVPHDGPELGVLNRDASYRKWLQLKGITYSTDEENFDALVYKEAEKIFLNKWRDELHFIPVKVMKDYTVYHDNEQGKQRVW